ncbi:hypothetical protein BE17_52815 [Sorangium cellulosum]|uniref:Uncharacterized protein n=1 Tax=Sorangium cellulosum TaxID=56 RepID=A0A150QRU2_SORCE|nr:hypothetical protein BE17_52815 [Sorangium cellulosum]
MRLAALTVCLGVVGCYTPLRSELTWSVVVTGQRAEPYKGEVRLVMEEDEEPETFTDIGLIQVVGTLANAEPEILQHHMQKLAARLGCNTVIRVRQDEGAELLSTTGVCGRAARTDAPPEPRPAAQDPPAGASADGNAPDSRLPGASGALENASPFNNDTVTTKTGEVVYGTIVVVESDRSVVIVDGTSGEPKSIPASTVERIERHSAEIVGDAAPKEAAAPDATAAPPPPHEPSTPGVVRVHIDTPDESMQLRRSLHTSIPRLRGTVVLTDGSEFICKTPCGVTVDARMGQEYFFRGDWTPPSERFQLVDTTGDILIPVKPGNIFVYPMSPGLIVGGAIGTGMGIPVTIFAFALDAPMAGKVISLSFLISSAAVLATGIVLNKVGRTEFSLPHRAPTARFAPYWEPREGLTWHF